MPLTGREVTVDNSGSGLPGERALDADDEAALQRAEVALAALRSTAAMAFGEDLAVAEAALRAARGGPEAVEPSLAALYDAAHCIKGLGGSLGFDLLTEIGRRLCARLKRRHREEADILILADAHLRAMRRVLDEDLRGDGGETGTALLAALDAQ